MKTIKTWMLLIAGLLLTASCANDDTANKENEQEPSTEGLTSFVEDDNTTRTTSEYDGSGLNFYWTAGDRLWVNNGTLVQDARNNINSQLVAGSVTGGVQRAAKAKFYFNGTFTASSYPVRYTGKNGTADKVTIKASQTQSVPNDASHIGEDGDFGVATATKPAGSGQYHFTLDHKASYITFMPYTTQEWGPNAVIQKIRIFTGNTSDALAGTFDLADDGTLSNPVSTSNSIEIDVKGGSWNGGFSIPSTETYATNAATMVVNPGTYSNVSIEYTLYDPVTYVTGTITTTYPSVTFTAGRNKKVKTDLQVKVYYPTDGYYMWDAAEGQHYWYGHLDADGNPDGNYPQNNTDPRWYREDTSWPCPAANRSAKNCPNANELIWYCMQGDPHWDQELRSMIGHLYKGGMWFLKKAHIAGFTDANYNSTDYRTTYNTFTNYSTSYGKPSNLNDYFYLPAFGYYNSGMLLNVGNDGFYWSSTPIPQETGGAYYLYFSDSYVNVSSFYRYYGFRLWTAQ